MTISQERCIREKPGYTLDIINRLKESVKQLQVERDALRDALMSASDMSAFIVNHVDLGNWYEKVVSEVKKSRETLAKLNHANRH